MSQVMHRLVPAAFLLFLPSLNAQVWDAPATLGDELREATSGKLSAAVESRVRLEERDGVNFGKDPDVETGLVRTRFGLTYKPLSWLKVSGMVQDSRAPWYGANAASNVRDEADLQEAYVELFSDAKTGFGMTAGRRMMNFGDGKLVGTPQWGNCSRTFDHVRLYYRLTRLRFEILVVSPAKLRMGEWNRPVLGDRMVGTYNQVSGIYRGSDLEWYILRRDQNRPGGFMGGSRALGTDHLEINTFGFRLAGPLTPKWKYTLEAAGQTGWVGPARHRAWAWWGNASRRSTVGGKAVESLIEYKFASGASNPQDKSRSRTFDQLYGAYHDTFGHQDLFGWRNVSTARLRESLGLTRRAALNFQYDSVWLASASDALYAGSGKAVAQSAAGKAGRHVGEEADLFATYKVNHWTVGAGYSYLSRGRFLQQTTRDVSPSYVYVFESYSF